MKQKTTIPPEKMLRVVEASMNAEGFELSESTKADCIAIMTGQISADDVVAKYVSEYRSRAEA